MNRDWYCIRTAPGAQRMAAPMAIPEEETDEQRIARERRKGESILERNLRNKGIDVYMPSFWTLTQHQRTNKLKEKRFPLLVGYAFVYIAQHQFEVVREIDGVSCFIRISSDRGPAAFPETDIGHLMFAEFEKQQEWEREREERLVKAQSHRRNALNKRLGLIFPKGKRRKMPLRMAAEAAIDSLTPASRNHVLLILNELNHMDKEVEACRTSSVALYSAA